MKKQKGITLIALVITIIVLLILAGVALNIVFNSGIIDKSEKAVDKYSEESAKEKLTLAIINYNIGTTSGEGKTLEEYIEEEGGEIEEETDTSYTVEIDGYEFIVDKDTSKIEDGETPETDAVGAGDVAKKPEIYYGAVVTNYTVADDDLQKNLDTEGIKWKIFYADDSNIYLIASDYVPAVNAPANSKGATPVYNDSFPYSLYLYNVYSAYNGASDITDDRLTKWNSLYYQSYSDSININMQCVAYLMDTSLWKKYTNTSYADYTIGGTTLEMWVASWNAKGYTTLYYQVYVNGYFYGKSSTEMIDPLDLTSDNSGYGDTLYFPHQNYTDRSYCFGYWLASPRGSDATALIFIPWDGEIAYNTYDNQVGGFRPLVCLSSDIQLQSNNDGTYSIIQ